MTATISEKIGGRLKCNCMPTADFAECVKYGYFNSFDGVGYYHDGVAQTSNVVDFNYREILKNRYTYPYVCWYEN